MVHRQGISFTMTLVVLGTVLLLTGITVTVYGGDAVTQLGQRSGEQNLAATVGEACANLGSTIDKNYCDGYVYTGGSNPDCSRMRGTQSGEYEMTAAQAGCNWLDQADGADPGGISSLLTGGRPLVTVRGNQYDCVEGGAMTTYCPAGAVSAWSGTTADATTTVSDEDEEGDGTDGDRDGDGVPDEEDDCPDTPEGARGENGCSEIDIRPTGIPCEYVAPGETRYCG